MFKFQRFRALKEDRSKQMAFEFITEQQSRITLMHLFAL